MKKNVMHRLLPGDRVEVQKSAFGNEWCPAIVLGPGGVNHVRVAVEEDGRKLLAYFTRVRGDRR